MAKENSEDKKLFKLIRSKLFTSVVSSQTPPHGLRAPSDWHWSQPLL